MTSPTFQRIPLALCAMLLVASCGKGDGQAKAAAAPPPPLQVATLRMAQQKVPVSLEAVGQAEGSREVEVRARVSGILEKRLYEEGAPVAANALLFEIDAAPYRLAVEQARAALQQERVRKELAETEARRLAPLAQDRAIPQREVDQAIATARQATAAIAAAEARLKEAELNLSYTTIRAPIGGISGRALKSEGSLVTANTESSLLTTLTQVDPLWVRFSLAQADYAAVRGNERGARVQLMAADGSVAADGGKLNFAGSTVDARLGTVQMRAAFANSGGKWLPGQYLKVRVLAGEQVAMKVPQAALLQGEQSRFVMTVGPEGKAVAKPVQTSSFIGPDAVITGGLAEGDLVIVDNLVKVRAGTPVQAKK
ncbi:MAG TPA: efflux RND transporter periplasmic adaptor subunit [Usitatibacter sp.]|nr:efflux RND transporter periplasmic adaptor subunit [Usitatibacter sp.]